MQEIMNVTKTLSGAPLEILLALIVLAALGLCGHFYINTR